MKKVDVVNPPQVWSNTACREPVLRFIRGVDWNRFNDGTTQRFTADAFIASPDSDRMGIRLDGPRLERSEDVDLLSDAVAPRTLRVPPSGKPILLSNDAQTSSVC